MAITAERLAQGMTFDEYMGQMGENKEKFTANYENFEIRPEDRDAICNMGVPLNVMIITEDWCGDALTYVPVLGKLFACATDWDLRIFLRDQNLDLADQYLNQGKWRSVPVVVFYDREMRELGRFIERPAIVNRQRQEAIDHTAAENPSVGRGVGYNDQTEEAKLLLAGPLRELRLSNTVAWQQAAVDEVCAALANVGRQ